MEKIIDRVARDLIMSELTHDKLLRHANKGVNEVYVVDAFNAPNTMREIGRLREIAFRDAGGGTGLSCDIDEFDTMETPCRQLVVWDPDDREIVGGYRFILGEDIKVNDGVPNIATSHMFRFSKRFIDEFLPHTLELGRSFVAIDYQNTKTHPKGLYVLDNLWDGLGALTVVYPQIEYLFGKVTMYPHYGVECRDMLLGFLHKYFHDTEALVTPIEELPSRARSEEIQSLFTGNSFKEDYRILNHAIRENGRNIPPLVNAYMSLSPTMKVFGTAINHEFGMVEETGIFFKISEIFEEKKRRHIHTFIETGCLPDSSLH
ncbi:MAG: GNAT family N-acetyltransferase [Muribaculaceae bacterium]|nr:GNAT family N-acetyltransferase [Muribaculaceae bacterium]MDE6399323.1 GNAT family N-acetyltransferase [Muribaculaceae bacterium]MDE6533866.1 GNAT family N-acetyltransferase [Muribaculaceae bacterium]MDE6772241.1 GNAT family N-acetyltransferase [Muribaculaceae bacterium]